MNYITTSQLLSALALSMHMDENNTTLLCMLSVILFQVHDDDILIGNFIDLTGNYQR